MRILALSDDQVPYIYSPAVRRRFAAVELIIGCGDLAYGYLEYVYNALDAPLYYVRGNHDHVVEYGSGGQRTGPHGGVDLHRRVIHTNGLLLAGIEGSARYRPGPFQYSQAEMWEHALALAPRLLLNRLIHRRALDILVTHAPPTGIGGEGAAGVHAADHPHRGVHAFEWLDRFFRPAIHLHGHIHLYSPSQPVEARLGSTRVINAYRYQELDCSAGSARQGER